MNVMTEDVIDRLKFNADDIPVILVGGGHFLIGDYLTGASEVLRPKNGDIANAIGAAIAQVGGHLRARAQSGGGGSNHPCSRARSAACYHWHCCTSGILRRISAMSARWAFSHPGMPRHYASVTPRVVCTCLILAQEYNSMVICWMNSVQESIKELIN